ncbi:hypothetical protein SA19061_01440 [Staphylococcus argenteus]|nr:hypothetical protein SA19061_01440 [Staphylococcus argenteus]
MLGMVAFYYNLPCKSKKYPIVASIIYIIEPTTKDLTCIRNGVCLLKIGPITKFPIAKIIGPAKKII